MRELSANYGIPVRTSDPSSPADGDMWYRSDTDELKARINGVSEVLTPKSYVDKWLPRYSYLAADVSRTSNTAFTATGMTLALLAASAVYEFEMFVLATGNSNGDLKIQFTWPSNTTIDIGAHVLDSTETTVETSFGDWSGVANDSSSPSATFNVGVVTGGAPSTGLWKGTVATNSSFTSGSIAAEFAQIVSNGTATTIKKGSFLRLQRIS